MNKKGEATEILMFGIILFFLAISMVIAAFVNSKFKEVVQTTVLNQSAASDEIINGLTMVSSTGVQNGFVFLYSFIIIAMFISSFLARVHPVWIFLYIIFLVIAVIIAVPLANTYHALSQTEVLSETFEQQTAINWVVQHSIKILIATAIITMIVLFAKKPQEAL